MMSCSKKVLGLLAGLLLLVGAAQAQFQGYVGLQTNQVQVLNASTATGRTVINANTGAGSSVITYCTTATALQIIAEGSPDGVSTHYIPVSTIYGVPSAINGNACGSIQFGGYYPAIAVNVLSISGGNVSVWYSGIAGPGPFTPPASNSFGGTSNVLCDQTHSVNLTAGGGTAALLIPNSYLITKTYVCGVFISFSAAPTSSTYVYLEGFTGGGTCTSSSTGNLYEFYVSSGSPLDFPVSLGGNSVTVVPAGSGICIGANTSFGSGISLYATASYAQF